MLRNYHLILFFYDYQVTESWVIRKRSICINSDIVGTFDPVPQSASTLKQYFEVNCQSFSVYFDGLRKWKKI